MGISGLLGKSESVRLRCGSSCAQGSLVVRRVPASGFVCCELWRHLLSAASSLDTLGSVWRVLAVLPQMRRAEGGLCIHLLVSVGVSSDKPFYQSPFKLGLKPSLM